MAGRQTGGCQKRGPAPSKTLRWRAERRPCSPQKERGQLKRRVDRRAVPLVLGEAQETGSPRAATKNRGGNALADASAPRT